jgi:Ser/Thr protein kinase RdoA (MazF antagonist)
MIPTAVLRDTRAGFGLPRGHVRVLSSQFGKVCLHHYTPRGLRTQLRLTRADAHQHTSDRLAAEMALLTHLGRKCGLHVPVPRPWSNGALVSPALTAVDGAAWHAVACSWVAGRHLNDGLRAANFRDAGAFLAAVHLASADAPAWIASARPRWDMARLFALSPRLPQLIQSPNSPPAGVTASLAMALREACAALTDAWSTLPDDAAHVGVIHTDVHQHNLRFARQSVGLVDFEDVATGRYMSDIASFWAEFDEQPRAVPLLHALLDGYSRVRPLPKDALRDLQIMLAFRRLDLAGWVLSWPRINMKRWGPALLADAPRYIMMHATA